MKTIRDIVLVLIVALVLPMLAGCAVTELENRLDTLENQVENQLDSVEHSVESSIRDAVLPNPTSRPQSGTEKYAPSQNQPQTPSAALTQEEAEEIALQHAQLAGTDVTLLRTEYEIDDGIPQYDVQFRQGHLEYEYEIHADTGAILSFERDD